MELIPESRQADDWYGPFIVDDEDVLERLTRLGHEVVALVPECVGLSLSMVDQGVTFTVAGKGLVTPVLDAVQYADTGPCLAALRGDGTVVDWEEPAGADAERSWHVYAMAAASVGVASSLSLPIVRDGTVVGGFNLYGSTADAFDSRHEQLADLLGAWAEGATTNADLGFTTLELARQAPELLRESTHLAVASTTLARLVHCEPDEATARLRRAALQASLPLPALAESIVVMMRDL